MSNQNSPAPIRQLLSAKDMNNRTLDWQILRYCGYGLLFLGGVYLLYSVRGALPYFFIGGLMAYAFEPLLQRLERRGNSRAAAVGFVFLIFVLLLMILAGLLAIAWQQALALAQNFPEYQDRAVEMAQNVRDRVENLRLPPAVKSSFDDVAQSAQGEALTFSGNLLKSIPTSLGSMLIYFIVVPLIAAYLMLEMNPLRARVLMLVPPMYRRDVTEIAGSINEMLGRYVRGQMIVCSIFGVLCTIAFYGLSIKYGMSYPLVLGLAAAFLYIVPYLGMAIIATAAALAGYFTSSEPVTCALIAVGCCVLFNLVIDYGISPRVLGQGVGLHPLLIIFALLSGNQLGGVVGMILAVPFFAAIRVILIYLFPQLTAPIPQTPPESDKPEGAETATDVLVQTRDAEVSTQKPVTES